MCCKSSFGPALNVPILAVPSDILTLPLILSLAILIVITVPAGTKCCKVIVSVVFRLLILAQLVAEAAAPEADGS